MAGKVKVELTLPQIKMLIDAANRMEADDIWDQYTATDCVVLERAVDALVIGAGKLDPNWAEG